MADSIEFLPVAVVIALLIALLLFYAYIASIRKVYTSLGLSPQAVFAILFGILILGFVPIPMFFYNDWIIGISVGGALIPLLVSIWLLSKGKVRVAEGFIGLVIVSFITYMITRVEPGVGIVADIEVAFIPAIASAFYSLSLFWEDIDRAAPMAFFSGTLGTLIGADVFHLSEILMTGPAPGEPDFLVIGGAHIFDMVFLSGFVAVSLDFIILHVQAQRRKMYSGYYTPDSKSDSRLVADYEKRRLVREDEILKRSKYWEKGIPYDPEMRKAELRREREMMKMKEKYTVTKTMMRKDYSK
ncbi:MAG TPA: DUF1614 domain-containing protein [Euryarchaeota archaeon]|nr:DUF1614 domain-containing protein [Euryarchaeota archaeon]